MTFEADDVVEAINEQKDKRLVIEVLPVGYGLAGWKVTHEHTGKIHWALRKLDALGWAVAYCWNKFLHEDQPVRLNIKGRNGKIQDERTYGNDPVESKG